jgi:hypothetical protein
MTPIFWLTPDTNLLHGQGEEGGRNNAVSPPRVAIEDFLKENKTLNVNMNITETQAGCSMNNKINFDSEKFARHGYMDNTRPPATIENLNNRKQVSFIQFF